MTKKIESICILLIFLIGTMLLSAKAPEQGALEIIDKQESFYETYEKEEVMEQSELYQETESAMPQKIVEHADVSEIEKRETAYKIAYETGKCLEVCDYIMMSQDEFMDVAGKKYGMRREEEGIIGDGTGTKIYFNEKGMNKALVDISYSVDASEAQYAWTLYGIPLYSSRDMLENGCLSGAIFVWPQHGSCIYGGLELQKKGIQYLYTCGTSEILSLMAKTNPDYIEQLKDYEYKWEEETFTYENKTKNVDIQIKYPVLGIPAHPDTAKQVNGNIQEAAFKKISGIKSPEELESYELRVDYRIENAAGDYISIRFDGIQRSDGVKSVFATGSTSSILEGGKKVRLDEVLGGKEELKIVETTILETDTYSRKEKERRISELFPNYYDYVITPFFVYYFGEPSEFSSDECTVTKYEREQEYRHLDWG